MLESRLLEQQRKNESLSLLEPQLDSTNFIDGSYLEALFDGPDLFSNLIMPPSPDENLFPSLPSTPADFFISDLLRSDL